MITQNKRLITIVLSIALLLLVPLIAMMFTSEVNWTLSDFIVAGLLLLTTGIACEFALRKVTKVPYRILICLIILAVFFLVWLELAVGIFGTPIGGN